MGALIKVATGADYLRIDVKQKEPEGVEERLLVELLEVPAEADVLVHLEDVEECADVLRLAREPVRAAQVSVVRGRSARFGADRRESAFLESIERI